MSNAQIRLDNPGDTIAAIPAVLGFVPQSSLVIVSLEQNRIGAVLRVDLADDPIGNAAQIAAVTAASGADNTILVVVDNDGALCPMCNEDHRRLGEALAAALVDEGVGMAALWVVDAVAAGGTWQCLGGVGQGTRGRVEDPSCSAMAAAAVLGGRRLYGKREELLDVIAVDNPARTAALTGVLEDCKRKRDNDLRTNPDDSQSRSVVDAMTAVALVTGGAELDDSQIADLACSLADGTVRDALYGLAVSAEAGRVEDTFAWLSRTLPDPWRAEALTMVAMFAYCRGDGPLAGIALEAALRINPAHRMATLLDTALQSGLRPNRIRELAESHRRTDTADER